MTNTDTTEAIDRPIATLTALRQAKWHWEHKANYERQQKVDAATELAEWGIFSNRQIERFTGLIQKDVAALTKKTTHEGGNLSGESLAPLLKLVIVYARGEINDRLVKEAYTAGASTRMIARLTGKTQSYIARAARPAVAA